MAGSSDQVRELSGLLLGAKARYRTARAVVHVALDGALATESDRRFMYYARRRGMVYYIGTLPPEDGSPPEGVPPHRTFEDSDEISRIWNEPPYRWRQETRLAGTAPQTWWSGPGVVTDPKVAYQVADGEGRWWHYDSPRMKERFSSDAFGAQRRTPGLAYLLDPSEKGFYYDLFDDTEPEVVGVGGRAGRETLEILAKTVSWDYPPWTDPFWPGADHHRLSVDAEAGVILYVSACMDGQEIQATKVTEIAFDEEFPEGTFLLDLPGWGSD